MIVAVTRSSSNLTQNPDVHRSSSHPDTAPINYLYDPASLAPELTRFQGTARANFASAYQETY